MTSCKKEKASKWSKESILCLIEAYKEEPCLYAVNTPNYHNKQSRNEALKNVCTAVSMIRPGTTEKECATKFYNLRNQFNVENAKVKSSIKSGIGTNDVYKPNLWYFEHLLFLESYFTSRKSRNSIEKNSETLFISTLNKVKRYFKLNDFCITTNYFYILNTKIIKILLYA
ncbi:uncharacterized protein LOC113004674 [Solenopsis invicta]|uniref:uncharacterized protein LOC113004674 n=1 Tax=Solenopsis invicta TaxID=13686 RepID=UPI00193E4B02|nr:uncharacterized protein LOC113004674 [Solenopsis invicta]